MSTETIIRLLTISALAGLLLTVGLRLTLTQVADSLKRCRIGLILFINFVVVPALALGFVRWARIDSSTAAGMILLAAAPFAPVVPVFARMARADLPLAAGLTSLVPVVSAFLTPLVCILSLKTLPAMGDVRLSIPAILLTLLATIIFPLGVGVAINRFTPQLGTRILLPIEKISEITGALSLIFVTVTQFNSILDTGWQAIGMMILLSEISLLLGYVSGGPDRGARQVVALGTSNRNIALALLVALESFPGTPVIPAVVANGFILIFLGLLHVAFWRLLPPLNRCDRPATP